MIYIQAKEQRMNRGDSFILPAKILLGNNMSNEEYTLQDADEVYFEIRECSHIFSSAVDKAPTCTRDGKETYTCTKCGYSNDSYVYFF